MTTPPSNDGLIDLVRPERLTSVVDIGANPIDGDAPYKEMLQRRICRLVGFDPQPDAFDRLWLPIPDGAYMSSAPWGHVAEWLRNGLQNRVHQFNSGRGLHPYNQ